MDRELSFKNSLLILLAAVFIVRSLSFFSVAHIKSGYDEHVYSIYTIALGDHGIGGLRDNLRYFEKDKDLNLGALPFRILFPSLGVIFCKALGGYNFFNLCLISYLFGIVTVIVAFIFFRKIFSPQVALGAALLFIISPLSMALSKRALQDSLFAFLVVSSFYFYHKYWVNSKLKDLVIFGFLVLCGLLTKESMVLIYFCFFIAGLYYYSKHKAISAWKNIFVVLGLASLGYVLNCLWIAGGLKLLVESYFKFFNLQAGNTFAIKTHSGEWFRCIVDFILLSPGVFLLAIAGACSVLKDQRNEEGRNICLIYSISGLFIFTCYIFKNVRYVLFVDVFLRALAVLGIYSLTDRINNLGLQRLFRVALIFIVCLTDVYQYLIIFVKWNTYDPVTAALTIANGFLIL